MGIKASLEGVEDYQRRLRGFAAQLVDLRPFWPTAARIARGWLKRQMDSEGSWGGDPWEPLSPSYAAYKAATRPGRPMLWYDGPLRRAVFAPRRIARPDSLELVIEEPKAAFHQEGTRRMPARPIIPERMPEKALEELRAAFDDHVSELIQRWGLRT